MLHKIFIKISKFLFILFVTTLLGYFITLTVINTLDTYINSTGFDSFTTQLYAILDYLETFVKGFF